ncbi:MAG: hypothetical protein KA536_07745 [Saprospiraceae bacterium]|nr:hypothetical protein [Saprospiraceae bacterium]
MKKIDVVKENGKVKEWVLDPKIDYDVFLNDQNSINLSVLKGLKLSDLFHLTKDDFPIVTDIYLMTEDKALEIEFIDAIGIYRRDEVFSFAFMFDNATIVDEILGYPANNVIKYIELVAKNKPFAEIKIPFEYDDAASLYISINFDFESNIKEHFFICQNMLKDIIIETTNYIDSIEKAINSKKFKLNLSQELKNPISQYLSFFSTYILKTKGVEVNLKIEEITDGIEILFDKKNDSNYDNINEWMMEFINHIKENTGIYEINYEIQRSENEQKILILSLNQQISHLKNYIDIIRLENNLLKDTNYFFKELLLNISSQKIEVKNLISNDTYNFIDNAISEYELLNNDDREFLKLIYENTSSESERKELIESLKNLKDPKVSEEDREKSKSKFRKFMEKGLSEATKQIFKKLIDASFENWIS